jgi:hypothetical protein
MNPREDPLSSTPIFHRLNVRWPGSWAGSSTPGGGEPPQRFEEHGAADAGRQGGGAHNATKHGILSRESLVKGESEADLVDFGKRLRAQLAPVGELEFLLVDRIVSTAWRLRRLVSVETMLFDKEQALDQAFGNYGREKMGALSRYEVTLERSLYKALHELQRLQAARDGQVVPLPVVVDVSVSDEADEMALIGENRAISGEAARQGVNK